jgi:integrase/recombinase XerD
MRYQYKREPLTPDEANRLANACQSHEEKLVVWTLLDTGLRVAELANLTKDNLDGSVAKTAGDLIQGVM